MIMSIFNDVYKSNLIDKFLLCEDYIMNTELAIEKMLKQQERDNELFKNMPIERIDDVITLIIPPEDVIVSKTVIAVNDDGVVVLRRFIDRKLWSVSFLGGLAIDKVQGWFDLSDEKFLRLAKLEAMN